MHLKGHRGRPKKIKGKNFTSQQRKIAATSEFKYNRVVLAYIFEGLT